MVLKLWCFKTSKNAVPLGERLEADFRCIRMVGLTPSPTRSTPFLQLLVPVIAFFGCATLSKVVFNGCIRRLYLTVMQSRRFTGSPRDAYTQVSSTL